MPGRDGTGPWGAGPRTGRGLGWCATPRGRVAPLAPMGYGGWGWRGRGRGARCWWGPPRAFGWGGFGPGWGRMGWQPPSPEEEVGYLKGYAANLERALEEIRREISAMERGKEGEEP
ncbi:MAG: DUF5320 domain-containing protein [Desulfacinum sp.]|nr:DUF5320 domain-containing protein [Desulfacinum sp.]